MKRVNTATQLKPIKVAGVKEDFPFDRRYVSIILDKKNKKSRKVHQIIYQTGKNFGNVGDRCASITHEELFELERDGMIKIN